MNVLLMFVKVCALHECNTAVAYEGPLPSMRAQMVIEFTGALDDSVAAVLELTLEKTKETIHTAVLFEFVDDVLLAVWYCLLVLGLAWVEVCAHYHIESPRLIDSRILSLNLPPKFFGKYIFDVFILPLILVIVDFLSNDGFNLLKTHVHVNEGLVVVRAVVVIVSHDVRITTLILVYLFLNLVGMSIFLDDFVKFVAIITVIVNRACQRVLLNFLTDLSLTRVEI